MWNTGSMGSEPRLRIALTPGEPAGIGPDIVIRTAQQDGEAELVAVASAALLQERARQLGLPLVLEPFDAGKAAAAHHRGRLKVLDRPLGAPVRAGRLDPANAPYVLATLESACRGCMEGVFDAMVTAPVHKGVINDAGLPFTGHTEFLAELTATALPVMMLTAPGLRVALLTTHVPLARVPALVTAERLRAVARILDGDLRRRFGIPHPRIVVLGLNPHAGEGGHLGREETEIVSPELDRLRRQGLDLIGPLPADTAFAPGHLAGVDAVLAMYHDQGLPVLKHRGFGEAVNVTLGLPIIRTSVDHGTALELAGSGRASAGSLAAALDSAMEQCRRLRADGHSQGLRTAVQ